MPRFTTLYSLALALLSVSAASSADVHKNLKLDFTVRRGDGNNDHVEGAQPQLKKRDGSPLLELVNLDTTYFANLEIGSNKDKVTVQIDTGSADLILIAKNATCDGNSSSNSCKQSGVFDQNASNSFKLNSSAPPVLAKYVDGSYGAGSWGQDTVSFGSTSLHNLSIGVVDNTTETHGIFGIALPGQEATNSNDTSTAYTYDNFPVLMKKQGLINRIMYSLYLNNTHGSVLFGAVDHSRYEGKLQTVPMVKYDTKTKDTDEYTGMITVLNSMSLNTNSQNITILNTTVPVVFDSGATVCVFPEPIVKTITSSMKAKKDEEGMYYVDCKYNNSAAWLDFGFSGAHIKMSMNSLITKQDGKCYLMFIDTTPAMSNAKEFVILGDSFLQNAYVVYDLENLEISLAQSKFSTKEDIEIVSSSVPKAVNASHYTYSSYASEITATFSGTQLKLTNSAASSKSSALVYLRAIAIGAFAIGLTFVI